MMVVLLSSCAQKSVFEELADGACNSEQAQLVNTHISGQIDAIAKEKWELAYSFASEGFREGVSIGEFIFIIGAQYGMLVKNKSYEFDKCSIANQQITQEVRVKSGKQVFDLYYTLSVNGIRLGVESATAAISDNNLNA